MRLDKNTEVCDRCGMLLHVPLVQFHKCNGTNMSARPANVPESVWNEALMKALGAQQVVVEKSSRGSAETKKQSTVEKDPVQYYNDNDNTPAAEKLSFVPLVVFMLTLVVLFGLIAYFGGR